MSRADLAPDVSLAAPSVPEVPGVAVGCDVVDVARVADLLRRRPAARTRLFTAHELAASTRDGIADDDPAAVRRLAARFAAKEALVKLLDRPALAWTDVEVHTDRDGRPSIRIHGEATDIAVSLSHDGATAMAVVARRTDRRTDGTDRTDRTDRTDDVSTPDPPIEPATARS